MEMEVAELEIDLPNPIPNQEGGNEEAILIDNDEPQDGLHNNEIEIIHLNQLQRDDDEGIVDVEEENFNDNGPLLNPLMIDHVLEKIMNFLSPEDLQSCRKVCTTWRAETKNVLQKNYIVKLNSVKQINAYIESMKDVPAHEFPHANYQFGPFTKIKGCQANAQIRYRHYRAAEVQGLIPPNHPLHHAPGANAMMMVQPFHDDNIHRPGNGAEDENNAVDRLPDHMNISDGYTLHCRDALRKFFSTFGNFIKKLEIDAYCEIPLSDFRQFLAEQTDNLEALSLTIRYNRIHRLFKDDEPFFKPKITTLSLRSSVEMVPLTLLKDFFIMAPNLRTLTCLPIFAQRRYSSPSNRVDFIRVLFHVFVMIPSEQVICTHLTNLDINLQLTDTELQGLITKNFPLKFITLGICSDVKAATLNSFMRNGSNRLVKIALNFHPRSPAASFRYDFHFPRLQSLSLCGFTGSCAFIKNCPQLKKLVIAKCGNVLSLFPAKGVGHIELQELFLQWDILNDPEGIRRITDFFPKLTSFSMRGGSDEVLREIYLRMPFLQKLTILQGGFTDSGITGIDEVVYKDIADSGSLSLVDAGKLRSNMSIGSLSNLHKLRLESKQMTDISMYLGIGSISGLQHLHLECPLLTDYCLWRIAKFPHISTLNLVSCGGLTMDSKMRLREDFRNQGRSVTFILETVQEVLMASQKRALILPDLSRYYRFNGEGLAAANAHHHAPMDFLDRPPRIDRFFQPVAEVRGPRFFQERLPVAEAGPPLDRGEAAVPPPNDDRRVAVFDILNSDSDSDDSDEDEYIRVLAHVGVDADDIAEPNINQEVRNFRRDLEARRREMREVRRMEMIRPRHRIHRGIQQFHGIRRPLLLRPERMEMDMDIPNIDIPPNMDEIRVEEFPPPRPPLLPVPPPVDRMNPAERQRMDVRMGLLGLVRRGVGVDRGGRFGGQVRGGAGGIGGGVMRQFGNMNPGMGDLPPPEPVDLFYLDDISEM